MGEQQPPPGWQPPEGRQVPPPAYPPQEQWQGGPPPPGAPSPTNGLGIAALVTGLLAIPLLLFFLFGAVVGIVAVVLGILGLRKARELGGAGRGMSITGIITGGLAIVLAVLAVAGLLALFQDPEVREMLEEELERQQELQEEPDQ